MMWRPDPPEQWGHLVDVIQSASEPAARDDGGTLAIDDIWRDTSTSPSVLYEWDGSQWVKMAGTPDYLIADDCSSLVFDEDCETILEAG